MENKTSGSKLISADSHFVEPPDLWLQRIDKKFIERAPRTVRGTINGLEGEFFVCEDLLPTRVAGFFGAGTPPEERAVQKTKTFDQAPKSVWDPAYRIKDQDLDGVAAEVIYPSCGMPLFGLADAELRAACFRAYNDWAIDYCSHDPARLVPLGLITLDDIPAGIAELTRLAKRGVKGALISAEPDERPYSSSVYDPFWAAAQDLALPLSLHILTGSGSNRMKLGQLNLEYTLTLARLHQQMERSLGSIVLGGVLERFPRLRLVSAENGIGWIPYWMVGHDEAQQKYGPQCGVRLPLLASQYLKRQVFATFIGAPELLDALGSFGRENMMWSSDYPHTAASFPTSVKVVEESMGALPAKQQRKLVHDTAAALYGLK